MDLLGHFNTFLAKIASLNDFLWAIGCSKNFIKSTILEKKIKIFWSILANFGNFRCISKFTTAWLIESLHDLIFYRVFFKENEKNFLFLPIFMFSNRKN